MISDKENQKAINRDTLRKSKMYGKDVSGQMPWCLKCEHRTDRNTCPIPKSRRDVENLCSIAYNRMKRQEV